jgi:diketogulonate reductase-like aldo/keto reductase
MFMQICHELDIAFLPWSPLGGIGRAGRLGAGHAAFGKIAHRHGVSAQQVCLSWMLGKSPTVVPIPGASRPETIRDSAAAAGLALAADEVAELDTAADTSGALR